MQVFDRIKGKIIEEPEYEEEKLEFLYHTKRGRFLLNLVIARPFYSKLRAVYHKSRFSKKDIKPFIEKYKVDLTGVKNAEFRNFNQFFTREKYVDIDDNRDLIISPVEGKLSVFDITEDLTVNIKQSVYTIKDLVGDTTLAEEYKNGYCLVFRLSMQDCHRFYYIDNGFRVRYKYIKGTLHTIRPISQEYNVFSRNSRAVSEFRFENIGRAVQIEVGALLVGGIRNKDEKWFEKGAEKGYFEYGGSTVILLLQKKRGSRILSIDSDILEQNAQGLEVKVGIGEKIGIVRSSVEC